ncbi:unnamed protein product [Acanthoscelides obtectus]|nr:unnamed protein product [Acanthoscelides obtectus]CAH1993989.1 unnamed protein product [Acanthoscelides obtectus]CAH2005762.1 unnamed protein product [Acanthoscelides obtectus]CAH2008756.1 unnamed protein product [Acanthoscelides obtectus]CAH2009034.1 unnamed protein product [Acanthoscelides obtectus]
MHATFIRWKKIANGHRLVRLPALYVPHK